MRLDDIPACPLCGSAGALAYAGVRDFFFNSVAGEYSFYRCQNAGCGVLWLNPAPLEEDIHLAYRRYYTHQEAAPVAKGARSSIHRVRASLYRGAQRALGIARLREDTEMMYLQHHASGRILDVGCGNGARLLRFRQKGWQVEGQEIDPNAAAQAKAAGISVFVGELEAAAFPADRFDAVVLSHVLEHLYHPIDLLAHCLRVLKPGGVLVAITPNANSWGLHQFGMYWRGLEAPRHICIYTSAGLRALAQKAGFGQFETWTTPALAETLFNLSTLYRQNPDQAVMTAPQGNTGSAIKGMRTQLAAQRAFKMNTDSGEECVLRAVK